MNFLNFCMQESHYTKIDLDIDLTKKLKIWIKFDWLTNHGLKGIVIWNSG
jgi:hypothetical protein